MSLLDRHLAFVEALRRAGLPASLAEGLDSVRAVTAVGLADREQLRAALAATLLTRQTHRRAFDELFDLYYPPRVGGRPAATVLDGPPADGPDADGSNDVATEQVLAGLRDQVTEAMAAQDGPRLAALAADAVQQLGAVPGRGPGMADWSPYSTVRRLDPDELTRRLTAALLAAAVDVTPRDAAQQAAQEAAAGRVQGFRALVEADVRRRVAERRGPEHVARTSVRPALDQVPFTSARQAELEEMRRQVYPLARRLATRLAREQHSRRRGPLDMRRTIRASLATGGVPLTTHHRPRRPHRPELVVLCDVSGSVAGFSSFTLLLVHALREQFSAVRAFTFVDDVHEVTGDLTRGDDPAATMAVLAGSARYASLLGRTNYGRAFSRFAERHADALTPRSSLLVLGDARSNFSDPRVDVLRGMVAASRHAWWLNPEHPGQWGVGDSAAAAYRAVVPMVECRNLTQLTEFVHDLV